MQESGELTESINRWEDDGGAASDSQLGLPSESEGGHWDLPLGRLDWITLPFGRFFRIHAIAAAVLLLAAVVALACSNSAWAHWYQSVWDNSLGFVIASDSFERPLRGWIADGLMTLFFFVIALELKRELVQGELRNLRFAALSLFGAIGGMAVPAGLFLLLAGESRGAWGTVTATDTAFAVGCLALLGSRIPPSLRIFVLSLAIFDDIGAILVIAIGYGHGVNVQAFAWIAIGLLVTTGAARLGVRSIPLYFVLGIAIWYFWDRSGVHPTLTGVALGLMTPTHRWVSPERLRSIVAGALIRSSKASPSRLPQVRHEGLRHSYKAIRESRSPVEQLEWMLHPWVAFAVLPLFALANAGVVIRDVDFSSPVIFSTAVALVIGKPAGVFIFCWIVIRSGIAQRPAGLTWPLLGACGMLTGIGFTMSLFIAELAYSPETLNDARFGILLASVMSAAMGISLICILTSRRPPFQADE